MHITSLHIYPIKSCAGTSVAVAEVTPRGLAGDRRWLVVDDEGRFLTQRVLPQMTQIYPEITDTGLIVRAPGVAPCTVLQPDDKAPRGRVRIWDDTVEALEATEAVHEWFSEVLGRPVRLVYQPEESLRPVDPDYGRSDDHVSFADGYPLLLANKASLAELNRRLDEPIPMDRFRPNVVVDCDDPFAEDRWQTVQAGAVAFRSVKPCARCVITTTNQQTGEQGKEPLRTLATFRKQNGKVLFGQNLIPDALGMLKIGDPVSVTLA